MKTIIILFTSLLPAFCYSQKQANIWYFADYSSLDFTNQTPVSTTNGQLHSETPNLEGCSSICDSSGRLLFYASPTTIWNRNHEPMLNGTNLLGGLSSSQGVLIIPKPGSNELFYVFTLDQFQNNLFNGLRYSIVNMCLDNGLGAVDASSKNTFLLGGTGEKMAATFHNNGTDIWLVTRKHFGNEFYSFLITSGGISEPIVSAIGWQESQNRFETAIGQMKISPNGKKIAFAAGNQFPCIVQLFDFTNSTGEISNLMNLSTSAGNAYGVAFSPDNSKLYVQGLTPTGLNQYDITSRNLDSVKNSLVEIPTTGGYGGYGLQLANNGKIYVVQLPELGVINFPNLPGFTCNFASRSIPSNAHYTLPSFIDNFAYKNGVPDCSVLPLTLGNFNAQFQKKSVLCKWQTLQEIDSDRFEIERSDDAAKFVRIGDVKSIGNSSTLINYTFTDLGPYSPAKDFLYYRLKIVDKDGRFSYGNVVSVKLKQDFNFYLSGQAVNDQLKIYLTTPINEKSSVSITDIAGKTVFNQTLSIQQGTNPILINTSSLTAGVYILTVKNRECRSEKFVKISR